MTGFKDGLRKKQREFHEVLERERLELLPRVKLAGPALKETGAKEVYLFGSILQPGYFDRASDIDILVVGLPDEYLWKALGIVERATGINEREINLVFDQMAEKGLIEAAKEQGVAL